MSEIKRLRMKRICFYMMIVTAQMGLISWFLSRWIVRPLKESIHRQTQFAADVSHELKTSLAVITANTGLLKARYGGISDEADRWLSRVNQECREMRSLLEGLLTLAKRDVCPGNRRNFRLFSLSELVTEKILIFEPVFYQEEKPFRYRVEEDIFMKGNPHEIGHMVQELIDNAVKYSRAKGCTEIRLEHAGRSKARLWVNSQGDPIPRDRRPLLFKRFYRDELEKDGKNGYGLGLAIAARTARNHKAAMGVDYKDGMNCFWVSMRKGR